MLPFRALLVLFGFVLATPRDESSQLSVGEECQETSLLQWPKHQRHSTGAQKKLLYQRDPVNWLGMNSYFLYALGKQTRHWALGNMSNAGVKVVRIFIAYVQAGFKGTDAMEVNHLEPADKDPGHYDYQVLDLINQLMADVVGYGMKLSIVLHDRYALGCYSNDAYVKYLGITSVAPHCGCWKRSCRKDCCPTTKINNASAFYYNTSATQFFDKRIRTVLKYRNPKLGNKPWGELSNAIAIVAPQNEASIALDNEDVKRWHCDRANTMRKFLSPRILIGTGGGQTFATSQWLEHYHCPSMDVITVHDYHASSWQAISSGVQTSALLATANGKRTIIEEFGSVYYNYRPTDLNAFGYASIFNGIPFMPWEYMLPGNIDNGDYEFDQTQNQTWAKVLELQDAATNGTWRGRFTWPNVPA